MLNLEQNFHNGLFCLLEHFEALPTIAFVSFQLTGKIYCTRFKYSWTLLNGHVLPISIILCVWKTVHIYTRPMIYSVCTDDAVSPGILTPPTASLWICLQSWSQLQLINKDWVPTEMVVVYCTCAGYSTSALFFSSECQIRSSDSHLTIAPPSLLSTGSQNSSWKSL